MFFFLFEIDFQWTKSIPFLTYPQCSVKNSISWRKDKTKLSATVRYWRKIVFVTRLSFLQYRQPYKADLLSIWKHGNAEGVKVIIITQWEQQVDGYGGRLDWGGTVGNMVGIALIRKGTLPTHHAMFVWNQQIRMQLERQLQLYVGSKDRCTLHRHEQKGNASDLGGAGWLATNWGRSHTNFAVLQLFLLQYNTFPVTHQIEEGPGYAQDASLGGCDGGRD